MRIAIRFWIAARVSVSVYSVPSQVSEGDDTVMNYWNIQNYMPLFGVGSSGVEALRAKIGNEATAKIQRWWRKKMQDQQPVRASILRLMRIADCGLRTSDCDEIRLHSAPSKVTLPIKEDSKGKKFVAVIGLPGSGKSSMVLGALGHPSADEHEMREPIKHVQFGDGVIYLGASSGNNPGTDTLPFKHEYIVKFMEQLPEGSMVIGEGSRITSTTLLGQIRDLGFSIKVIRVNTAEDLCKSRVIGRRGKDYNDMFWKSRKTQVQKFGWRDIQEINGDQPLALATEELRKIIYNNNHAKIQDK